MPAPILRQQAGVGVGGGRGVQPQPCPAGPTPRVAPAKPRRDFLGGQVGLDPGVGVRLPHLVRLATAVVLVALESQDHPRRNPLAAEHQRQRGGKILAVPPAICENEVLDRVQAVVARLALKRILELAGCKELLLQHPRAAEVIAGGQTALGQPLPRQFGRVRHVGQLQERRHVLRPIVGDPAHPGIVAGHERRRLALVERRRAQFVSENAVLRALLPPQSPQRAVHVDPLILRIGDRRPDAEQLIAVQWIDGDLLHDDRRRRAGRPGGDAGGDVGVVGGVQTVFAAAGDVVAPTSVLIMRQRDSAEVKMRLGGVRLAGRSIGQLHPHHVLATLQDAAQLAQGDGVVEADNRPLRRWRGAPGRAAQAGNGAEDHRRQNQRADAGHRQPPDQLADHPRPAPEVAAPGEGVLGRQQGPADPGRVGQPRQGLAAGVPAPLRVQQQQRRADMPVITYAANSPPKTAPWLNQAATTTCNRLRMANCQ